MKITDFPKILDVFLKNNKKIIGNIALEISEPIDIAIFPDEINKIPESNNGIYLFFSKIDNRLLYVGISTGISSRIYNHIGPGFSWSREGNKAQFPNVTLTEGRGWVKKETKNLFENAEIKIITIGVSPPEASSLLESYIIFYGFKKGEKPELNVDF